jgi:hypothetical protein
VAGVVHQHIASDPERRIDRRRDEQPHRADAQRCAQILPCGPTRDGTDQLKLRIVEDRLCDGAAGPAGCARHADADHATTSGIMPTPSGLWMEWVIEV